MGEAELAVLDRFEEVTKRPELMLEFDVGGSAGDKIRRISQA
jgi:hypothetical protein